MGSNLKVEKDQIVSISYTLKDQDGNILDQASPAQAYDYLHGYGQLLEVIESHLEGQEAGFTTSLIVGANDGFGEFRDELIADVDKTEFSGVDEIKVGMRFATLGPDGEDRAVEVIEIKDTSVVIDGNHPLAGIDLFYDIEVLSVREATEEELKSESASVSDKQLH